MKIDDWVYVTINNERTFGKIVDDDHGHFYVVRVITYNATVVRNAFEIELISDNNKLMQLFLEN
jgi:hypothetical protein